MKTVTLSILFFAGLVSIEYSQVSAGGNYTLDQSVIATGGGTSTGGTLKVDGTSGQSTAGQRVATVPYADHAGFWNAAPLSPSAAMVSVGGRVQTTDGQGVRNVYVSITANGGGRTRIALTGPFGYFRFEEIEVGETYIVSVVSKRFQFAEPILFITVEDSLDNMNFTALPN